jgi:predicted DNA-binding helix-hairpin-helix protein
VREHRLYQSDWLIRFYGFRAEELTDAADPHLSLDLDPKHAWALRNPDFFPVDINAAPREALLRTPGLGVRTVERILEARRVRRLRLEDLRSIRVPLKRARPFIVTPDWSPPDRDAPALRTISHASLASRPAKAEQRLLFDASLSARTGEL